MQFLLDCSVAISWCLVDENNPTTNGILAMMSAAEAFVPGIWSLEIANVLLVAERRHRMTTEQSSEAIALLQSLLIGSISPSQGSIYTHGSKRSTYGLSTTLLPRHLNYATSKVTCSLS